MVDKLELGAGVQAKAIAPYGQGALTVFLKGIIAFVAESQPVAFWKAAAGHII